ncbi:MAG: formylglycine-generating enzyme family protein [Alphaproteobacteria bacterium]|nr:formylglycine-generating enzyme family protein [Alphaproteobacteria bacterium]
MRRWLPALALALVFAVPVAAAESDLDLVALPGGLTWIGDAEGGPDEALHQVEVAPFHLMRHEVTNRQFGAFVAATGHRTDAEKHGGGFVWPGRWVWRKGADWRHPRGPGSHIDGRDDHPVVQVSQNDALAFCAFHGLRLPSEAEWVHAARGVDQRRFAWGDEPPTQSGERRTNFGTVKCCALDASDGYEHTAPVGAFPAGRSPFGLEDMTGSVWEWTSIIENGEVIIKGGGFGNNPDGLRIGLRHDNPPDTPLDMVGIRCAASAF